MDSFYGVQEIMAILKIGKKTAYEIIRNLNKELAELGYLTKRGKVSKQYFHDRYHL